jgi:hypothetical protein
MMWSTGWLPRGNCSRNENSLEFKVSIAEQPFFKPCGTRKKSGARLIWKAKCGEIRF